jgi:hypothetical protein
MKKTSSTAVRDQRGTGAPTTASRADGSHARAHEDRQDPSSWARGARRHVLTPAPMDPSNWLG